MTDRAERRRYLDVADHILRAVTAGAITRGDRLPNERELGAQCGVSRSSVREALLALELGGVLESRPGSGWYLTGVGVPTSTPEWGRSEGGGSSWSCLVVNRSSREEPGERIEAAGWGQVV